jgi:hypothetical protein
MDFAPCHWQLDRRYPPEKTVSNIWRLTFTCPELGKDTYKLILLTEAEYQQWSVADAFGPDADDSYFLIEGDRLVGRRWLDPPP